MGLDSFWRGQDGTEGVVQGQYNLCGGMLSGHGNSSFRGKVYDRVVDTLTGVSLYQEEIPSETVKQMAEKLSAVPYSRAVLADSGLDPDEWQDLVRMFQEHAKMDHKLLGWW